jgi:hypothetical protein
MALKYMKANYRLLLIVVFACLSGCAPVIMPTISANYPENTRVSDITAAAIVTLQNHEFSTATVNDNIGLVTTHWRDVKPTGIKVLEAFSSLSNPPVKQTWRMMITMTVDKQTRQIRLKPIKQIESTTGGWNNAKLGDEEREMLDKIVNGILSAINAPATLVEWDPPTNRRQVPMSSTPETAQYKAKSYTFSELNYSPFSIGFEYQVDLDNGRFSETLRNEFLNRGRILAPDANILIEKTSDDEWLIVDTLHAQGFYIKKGEYRLNVNQGTAQPLIPTQETHEYYLFIVDINNNPLEGATIEYSVFDKEDLVQQEIFSTGNDGILNKTVEATSEGKPPAFRTKFNYRITKEGHYTKNGSLEVIGIPLGDYSRIKKAEVTMIRPVDELNPTFASSKEGISLQGKILTFVEDTRQRSLFGNFSMELQSIDLIAFKNKKYLQFQLVNTKSYDLQKLNKYDIGKKIFDDTLRKLLTPLNQHLDSEEFYGYDLKFIGDLKSMSDEDVIGETRVSQPIEYRFMMPKEVVRKYKDKDISGQQLLNESIILMDDERIELKLQ